MRLGNEKAALGVDNIFHAVPPWPHQNWKPKEGPAPSFTPSSLPVLVPVLNLSRSHSVARENRRHTVFMRESSHSSTLNQTQSYIGWFALPRRGSGVQIPFPAPKFLTSSTELNPLLFSPGTKNFLRFLFSQNPHPLKFHHSERPVL